MPTSRTVTAGQPGVIDLIADVGSFDLNVTADPTIGTAQVLITSSSDDDALLNLVDVEASGGALRITMPHGGTSTSVVQNSRVGGGVIQTASAQGNSTIIQSGRDVNISRAGGMNIQIGDGNVQNNVFIDGGGYSVSQSGGGVVVTGPGETVTVTAWVPAGSNLTFTSLSGDLHVEGGLKIVGTNTNAGDVNLDHVQDADVRTVSGDVRIRNLVRSADVRTGSGDVKVHGHNDARLDVRTGSGDITYSRNMSCSPRTVSGDINAVAGR